MDTAPSTGAGGSFTPAAPANTEAFAAALRASLPLRLELDAILRVLATIGVENRSCLDLGFPNPLMSKSLRQCGGYWQTAAQTVGEREAAAAVLREDVPALGPQGQLPYEDKQFDLVVVGLGRLSGIAAEDAALVREVHRVLRSPGYIVLGAPYRKAAGLAYPLGRLAGWDGPGAYTESQMFELLKTGFDVLGVRTYFRFWVQLVRLFLDRPGRSRAVAPFLYRLAFQLDLIIFFTRGYRMVAYGRRKGWRPRQTPVLSDGRNITEAVLKQTGR